MSRETNSVREEAGQASHDGTRRATTATTLIADGFVVGRERGRDCGVADILYATAAATGFMVGVAETLLETLASPLTWAFGCVVGEAAE
jgi:hypothetical protein